MKSIHAIILMNLLGGTKKTFFISQNWKRHYTKQNTEFTSLLSDHDNFYIQFQINLCSICHILLFFYEFYRNDMRESLCACDEENKNPISVSSETQISSCLHFVGKMSEYSKKQFNCILWHFSQDVERGKNIFNESKT